jgi:uncharacterized membrane protein YkoI
MMPESEAIEIARKAVEGTFEAGELERIEVMKSNGEYIVKFILIVPPLTVGSGFIEVTLNGYTGEVLEKLRDAD